MFRIGWLGISVSLKSVLLKSVPLKVIVRILIWKSIST
jgi:hypothetical protein